MNNYSKANTYSICVCPKLKIKFKMLTYLDSFMIRKFKQHFSQVRYRTLYIRNADRFNNFI